MSLIRKFLSDTKCAMTSSCPSMRHVVMGNEACDLDSAVSAIVYAYLLYSLREATEKVVIPVLNIPREDYPLKTEVSYWLNKHNITQENLIFRDEIDLNEKDSDTVLTLVDHNVLYAGDSHLEPKVISILDHHKMERPYPEKVKDGIILEMVGSCATLVAEEMLKKLSVIPESTIADLLYGTIILDTVNLNKAAKRVTEKDIEMCERLQKFVTPMSNSSEIFKNLTSAKGDISSLTSEQLLRKDVKVVENNGIRIAVASVPMAVKTFFDRADVLSALRHSSDEKSFDVFGIMGITIENENVSRDIAVFSKNAELKLKVATHLCDAGEGVLQLKPLNIHLEDCLVYQQGNYGASRKVVLPFIKEWLALNSP